MCTQIGHFQKIHHLQGAVLVGQGKKIHCAYADGVRNIFYDPPTTIDQTYFTPFPISPDTQFMIGHISQQFVNIAFLKTYWQTFENEKDNLLRQEKFLNGLNVPVSFYLNESHPIWPGKIPKWAHYVTLFHLLTHTSGLPDYTKKEFFVKKHGRMKFYEFFHNDQQILAPIIHGKTLFQPGSYIYESTTNQLLLRIILEHLTKKPIAETLSDLFNKYGLNKTKPLLEKIARDQEDEMDFPDLIQSLVHSENNPFSGYELPVRHTNIANVKGIGSVISTVHDLHQWITNLHIDKVVIQDLWLYDTIFKNQTLDIPAWQEKNKKNDFALGFKIAAGDKKIVFIERGNIDHFSTIMSFDAASQEILIAMTNTGPFWLSKKGFKQRKYPSKNAIWPMIVRKKSDHYKAYLRNE